MDAPGDAWFIVLRPADGVDPGALGGSLVGTWLNVGGKPPDSFLLGGVHAVATDQWETRADGATARVYEVAPSMNADDAVLPPGDAAPGDDSRQK